MITQSEILAYAKLSEEVEALETKYKEITANLKDRMAKKEKVEAGKLNLKFTPYDRNTTQWKQVVEGLLAVVESRMGSPVEAVRKFAVVLQDKYDNLADKFSNVSHQAKLEIRVKKAITLEKEVKYGG